MSPNHTIDGQFDTEEAQAFLTEKLGRTIADVTLVGAGAWSHCFGFRQGADEMVIRFGQYVDDFEKDQLAHRYATPALPIPEVLDIGPTDAGYYAISRRVHGSPLEAVTAEQWAAVVPSLVAAMEALRTADLSITTGFGGWGSDGNGANATWSEHLLAVDRDAPDRRTYGWRQRLATFSPEGEAAFQWGYALLQAVAMDAVPRCLLHCDLINRNVLVEDAKIAGVFDWGCSIYGDHLYELAWFEFWAPWMPELDVSLLRAELEKQWQAIGYVPEKKEERLAACYLHIGLDHLAYNAYLGDWTTLLATAEQMRRLVTAVSPP
ncbi:MAG: phosphotransferase [Ardenticatenaceae bacterium]|nr:phosphotransferase [Ardenticatenaceae bacterium]